MGDQHIKDEQDRIFLQGQQQSMQLSQLRTKYRMVYQDNEMKLQRLRLKVSNSGGGVMNRVNMKEMELAELRRNKSKADLEYKSAQSMLDGLNQTLANGQIWRVADDSQASIIELDNPKVKLVRNTIGTIFLEIEGTKQSPRVRRVQ